MKDNSSRLGFTDKIKIMLGKEQDNDGLIYDSNRLMKAKSNSSSEYIVKDGTKIICDGAFKGKSKLRKIVLPNSVVAIGKGAFGGCKNLDLLRLPINKMEHIGNKAFPKKLSMIEAGNIDISLLKRSCFEGISDYKTIIPIPDSNKGYTIRIAKNKVKDLENNIGDFAKIESLNSRDAVNLGINNAGELLTYAKIILTLPQGAKEIYTTQSPKYLLAKDFANLHIQIMNVRDEILFADNTFVVDGDIDANETHSNLSLEDLGKEYSDLFNIKTFNRQGLVSKLLADKVKSELCDKSQDNKLEDLKEEIFINPINNLKIEFIIRLKDGIFDSSKLNFIYFSNDNLKTGSNLHSSIGEYRHLLNLIVYKGHAIEGVIKNSSIIKSEQQVLCFKPTFDMTHNSDSHKIHFNLAEVGVSEPFGKNEIWREYEVGYDTNLSELAFLKRKDEKKAKWGFKSQSEKWIIEPIFDDLKSFSENLAPAKINKKWGYIDRNGKIVIQPQFDECTSFSDGIAWVNVKDKWGLINKNGMFLLDPIVSNKYSFKEGLARVRVNNKYGFISRQGEFIIEPKYADAMDFSEGLAPVLKLYSTGAKWGFVDVWGEMIIHPNWDYARGFSEGRAAVANLRTQNILSNFIKGRMEDPTEQWGFINRNGDVVIPLQYAEVDSFCDGVVRVYMIDDENDDGFLIDENGTTIEG